MVKRFFWVERLEEAFKRKTIIWLMGVRRAGKTTLAKSLEGVQYFDCELPRVRAQMADPESFLEGLQGKKIVLDEIHRLDNPSELLKIAADHFPKIKIIATGSSTLHSSFKFKDTLTGRKEEIWLTPMNDQDLHDFGKKNMSHRLYRGGLPPFFLSDIYPENQFQEWIDSYWAKDIQELFRIERRWSFQKLLELLFVNSGGIFEAASYASPCEISRTTVANYLDVFESTQVAHIVRPFSSNRSSEIITAPKVYGFDTGFVCYYRGWNQLRKEDMGVLWEHYVLNELHSRLPGSPIQYWRDKQGHEVDFVIKNRGQPPVAIECKWSARAFDPNALLIFRKKYPMGRNLVVAHDIDRPFVRKEKGIKIEFVNLKILQSL